MAPFYIRKEDKDMIKRKIDRHLADFFETDKKRVGKITYLPIYMLILSKRNRVCLPNIPLI